MHVKHTVVSRRFVESIHILGTDQHATAQFLFQASQGDMAWVRLTTGSHGATHGVEAPDQLRVPLEGLRSCELLSPVSFPQPALSTERRNATLGTDPCTCQDEQPI